MTIYEWSIWTDVSSRIKVVTAVIKRIHPLRTMNNEKSCKEMHTYNNVQHHTQSRRKFNDCARGKLKGQRFTELLSKQPLGTDCHGKLAGRFFSVKAKPFWAVSMLFYTGSQFKSRAQSRGHHQRDTSDSLSVDQPITAFKDLKNSFLFSFLRSLPLWQTHRPRHWKQTHRRNAAKNLWAGGNIQQAEEKQLQ